MAPIRAANEGEGKGINATTPASSSSIVHGGAKGRGEGSISPSELGGS
jgi:hypothetical protein